MRLLLDSANDGNGWAQYPLGKFCFCGEHTEKNLQKTERLLTASAVQKNSPAQYLLTKMYLYGDGIPKDAPKAIHWLKISPEQENQYAQYQLGKMLLFGKDVEHGKEKGIVLLTASAEQGNVYAARLLQSYHSGRLQNFLSAWRPFACSPSSPVCLRIISTETRPVRSSAKSCKV